MNPKEINPQAILTKIKQLTTPLGIYQFGKLDQPDPSYGYALDDQARALIIADALKEEGLKEIYQQYLIRSQRPDGLLYQFSDSQGKFIDNSSVKETNTAQDSYGETLWALLRTNSLEPKQLKSITENLLENASNWQYFRAMAYALIGLTALEEATPLEKKFTKEFLQGFERNATSDWFWLEDSLIYANAVIPWALWEVALARKDGKAKEIAQKSTNFLIKICQVDGLAAPIGYEGWYPKGGEKALYGQQPICAGYMVGCLEKAYQATKDPLYFTWAQKWWNWFWGENIAKKSLIDKNFGCFDGINRDGLNPNRGAESNICFILAWLSAKRMNL